MGFLSQLLNFGVSSFPFFFLFMATPVVHGTNQSCGWSLCHSPRSELHWDLCCSLRQHWILNPLSEARDQTDILMDTSWVCYHWTTTGTPLYAFLYFSDKQNFFHGVPTVAQWAKKPTAAAWVTMEAQAWSLAWQSGLKDPAEPQLQCRSQLWLIQSLQSFKKKKERKKRITFVKRKIGMFLFQCKIWLQGQTWKWKLSFADYSLCRPSFCTGKTWIIALG